MSVATQPVESRPSPWIVLAAVVSLAAVAGSIYLSTVMGLQACPLCVYERTFAFGVAGVLWAGLLTRGTRPGALALPLAAGGLVVAGLHVYLEATGALECPRGIAEIGSAPQQSIAAFALLALLLLADAVGARVNALALVGIIIVGGLLGYGAIASAPKRVTPDYATSVDEDMCRKPQTPPQ